MGSGDNLIKTFASCFRLLAKLNTGMRDGFFIDLISNESESLLSEYIKFLKTRGNTIVQRNHVAQCSDTLKTRIGLILKLLEIIKHVDQANSATTPLFLERELLKLKLSLLDHVGTVRTADMKANSEAIASKNKNPKKPAKLQELGVAHKQITEFVKSKERVQNVEVFSQFADTTRRTLKRKLSELVKAGAIKRLPLGKKVFYTVV